MKHSRTPRWRLQSSSADRVRMRLNGSLWNSQKGCACSANLPVMLSPASFLAAARWTYNWGVAESSRRRIVAPPADAVAPHRVEHLQRCRGLLARGHQLRAMRPSVRRSRGSRGALSPPGEEEQGTDRREGWIFAGAHRSGRWPALLMQLRHEMPSPVCYRTPALPSRIASSVTLRNEHAAAVALPPSTTSAVA